jgi:hypothetical protein
MSKEVVDFGAMRIPRETGVEIQVQAQQDTGAIVQVTLVAGQAAVQVQPFAAPKSGGLWDQVRGQLRAQVNQGGGLVEEVDGPFGVELHAQVRQEKGGMQPVRFVAVEGERWILRAVFMGAAARPGPDAAILENLVQAIDVSRGDIAMPVGSPLPLALPGPGVDAESSPDQLNPFERGPEITETR